MLTAYSLPGPNKSCKAFSILVIDRDLSSISAIRAATLELGVEVFTTADPEEGIDLFRGRQPQIVIASLIQPGMSGIELLTRILGIDACAHVILTSGYSSLEAAVEAVTNG